VILVDTSVWVDHLHRREASLAAALEKDEALVHPFVIEELAVGALAQRGVVLELLRHLRRPPVLDHDETLALIETHHLWGRGLSAVDVHLIGSALLAVSSSLWTRDKRLIDAARESGATVFVES
jgi:predicted nucleic acid-binding protein